MGEVGYARVQRGQAIRGEVQLGERGRQLDRVKVVELVTGEIQNRG